MTPDERATLLERIDNHHAAMQAQVDDPGVRLEFLDEFGHWFPASMNIRLFGKDGTHPCLWYRLAPAPKMVDLDQSDFRGPNRVTHIRPPDNDELGLLGVAVDTIYRDGVESKAFRVSFAELSRDWECSRDNGAPGSWGPCSKEAKV